MSDPHKRGGGARINPGVLRRVDIDEVFKRPGVTAAPPPADEPPEPGPTEVAIIARGHSIDIPIPGKRRRVGFDLEGRRDVLAAMCKRHYPGETVRLPVSEVKRLRRLGFLVDPRSPAAAGQIGAADTATD